MKLDDGSRGDYPKKAYYQLAEKEKIYLGKL